MHVCIAAVCGVSCFAVRRGVVWVGGAISCWVGVLTGKRSWLVILVDFSD